MEKIDSSVDFAEYLSFVGHQEADQITGIEAGLDGAMERIRQGPKTFGATMPWEKTHDLIRFRPAEVTVWSGVNKHGKTEVLANCLIPWALEGRVLNISLEMPIEVLAQRFLQQATARYQPDERWCRAAMQAVAGKFLVYDEVGSVDSETILGIVAYGAKQLKCQHIVVDSLVKCKLTMVQDQAADAQRNFIDKLSWIAKHTKTHIHLVHHMRKGESEDSPGNKMDVKGAGEITDLCDNILLIWRNKPKELELWDAEQNGQPPHSCSKLEEPDTIICVAGQREGGREGNIGLWFDRDSRRYLSSRRDIAFPYVGVGVDP